MDIYIASVIFLICSVAFFLSLLPLRSFGRSNFDWGLQKLTNVDSNNDIQILKITMLCICTSIYIYGYIYIYPYIYLFVGCVVLAINKSTMKQNNMRHCT